MCREHELVFIGPSGKIINAMGDKASAKETMQAAGVPVIPGSDGLVKSVHEAGEIAEKIGYPVILKATAGGGGRGMRVVYRPEDLENFYNMAQAESGTAFGNDALYLEKFVERPRHIEIQVIADSHGNVFHLGERECSIQRRHQKLLEESPSAAVDPELRKRMGDAAITGARAAGYVGAGTVEFVRNKDHDFYFMEMNTRIQVEHPVTELVTGLDLIKLQIKCHAEETLPDWLGDLNLRGHAIECRINAEDPSRNFMPSSLPVENVHFPGGTGVRVDSHIYAGYEIPPYYDSMVAKLIVHGRDRSEAISRMHGALQEFIIEGPRTTIPFHTQLLENTAFQAGHFDTHFLETFQFNPEREES